MPYPTMLFYLILPHKLYRYNLGLFLFGYHGHLAFFTIEGEAETTPVGR